MEKKKSRERIIIKTSVIGIITNVLLAAFKAVIGLAVHSIAVVLDAVNNLSDVVSSVVTIIGTKLAAKAPDRKHPMGHGRIEYVTQMIVASIVLYAGIASLKESIKKIITPTKPQYTTVSLVIIFVAIIVKLILGTYVKKKGKEVNSGSLIASGSDALFDAILSTSVLITAIFFIMTKISLEAYLGVIISVIIIKSGIEMFKDGLEDILGKRVDIETVKTVKEIVCREPEVHGAFDLDLHNYGPDHLIGSVHVEVNDTMSAGEIDALTRRIQSAVYKETEIIIESITIYAVNTTDEEVKAIRDEVEKLVLAHEDVLSIHGFFVDKDSKLMRFDYVTSYDSKNMDKTYIDIEEELEDKYPDYDIMIVRDYDLS